MYRVEGPGGPIARGVQIPPDRRQDGMDPGAIGWEILTLQSGNYELICILPGHYAAGMHASLTVGYGRVAGGIGGLHRSLVWPGFPTGCWPSPTTWWRTSVIMRVFDPDVVDVIWRRVEPLLPQQ